MKNFLIGPFPPPFPSPNPNPSPTPPPENPPPLPPPPPPPPVAAVSGGGGQGFRRPRLRVTTEYDSEEQLFTHKLSCKVADGIAKLKLLLYSDRDGQIIGPMVGLATKHFSAMYDVYGRDAVLKGHAGLGIGGGGSWFEVHGTHNTLAQNGEIVTATNFGPSCKLELSSNVPYDGLGKATFHFPLGEVSVEEKKIEEDDKVLKALSLSGIVKTDFLDGILTAQYKENDLNLRYCYKDDELSFIPSVTLPSHAMSLALKRRFGPSDKLSYSYYFDSDDWSAVYKHTLGKDFKLKAGYDTAARLGWACLWLGEEDGKTKTAPVKMKVQLMVQVPQNNISSTTVMFRVKKRWDL